MTRFECTRGDREPTPAARRIVDEFAAFLRGDPHAARSLMPPRAWHGTRHPETAELVASDEVVEVIRYDWAGDSVIVRQRYAHGRHGTTRLWLNRVIITDGATQLGDTLL